MQISLTMGAIPPTLMKSEIALQWVVIALNAIKFAFHIIIFA
jgi:hypothetical protein